ncbi:MAG: hypothetical protein KC656_36410, partial [Myxococcales bacterium]|nr:hypothetical protein [Myxococcales bacterium]
IERVMLPEATIPLALWIDPSTDRVRGWWLVGSYDERQAYEVQRHQANGGWTADPCHDGMLREIDRQSPAYLRALATLRERPTEVIEKRTVEVLTTRTTREALVEGVTRA